VLLDAMSGRTIRLTLDNVVCRGGKMGFGFCDAMEIPGGYGPFIADGAGPGFPPGMRLKRDAELAEMGRQNGPLQVMEGYSVIEIKPYESGDNPDLVTMLANADQLSALNLLFHFGRQRNDDILFPAGSGCSSIFRLPLSELRRDFPRAVIGNADVSSRVYFEAGTLFFTVSGSDFHQMLSDSDRSFLTAAAWKKLRNRV